MIGMEYFPNIGSLRKKPENQLENAFDSFLNISTKCLISPSSLAFLPFFFSLPLFFVLTFLLLSLPLCSFSSSYFSTVLYHFSNPLSSFSPLFHLMYIQVSKFSTSKIWAIHFFGGNSPRHKTFSSIFGLCSLDARSKCSIVTIKNNNNKKDFRYRCLN